VLALVGLMADRPRWKRPEGHGMVRQAPRHQPATPCQLRVAFHRHPGHRKERKRFSDLRNGKNLQRRTRSIREPVGPGGNHEQLAGPGRAFCVSRRPYSVCRHLRLNGRRDRVSVTTAPYPLRVRHNATVVENKIYVAGGTVTRTLLAPPARHRHDPLSDRWTSWPLCQKLQRFGIATCQQDYVTGGRTCDDFDG
jgi:hypothetical protein